MKIKKNTNCIYVLHATGCAIGPVTFECEVVLWIGGIDVVYGYPALDTAQSKASGSSVVFFVQKYADNTMLQPSNFTKLLQYGQTISYNYTSFEHSYNFSLNIL